MTHISEAPLRQKFFIIHNPNSGNKKHRLFKKTCHLLEKSGADLTLYPTSSFGEGGKASKQAALSGDFDAVIAVGGDGTIQDVATGLLGSPTPLGIIPTGTGNVLARELNYKFTAPFIANNLLKTPARPIHAAMANDLPFLFAASIGYDADVVKGFEDNDGRRFGRAGYAMPGLRALMSNKGSVLNVQFKGETYQADWVIVSRVRFYASDFLLCPKADIANDLFHIVLFTGKGKFLRMRQLIGLATGRLAKMPSVSFHTAQTLTIGGKNDNAIQIDGEPVGILPLTFKIHPQTISIIAPTTA